MLEFKVVDPQLEGVYSRFVAGHPKGHILQTLEWGEVKRRMGWTPIALLLLEDGVAKAGILLLKRNIPLPGLRKCIFYAPRGPVADVHDCDSMDRLFEGVRAVARQHGAIFLKMDPNVDHSDQVFRDYLTSRGFRKTVTAEGFEGVQPTFVFRMDINKSEDDLLAQMSTKTRYNLRLAERKGVTIREGTNKADLKVFYDILEETAERDRFLIRGYKYFEVMWDWLVERGLGQVFLAEFEGKVISGTLALRLGAKTWYLYGASANQYRNVMPNYLIQWTMIKWAKEQGCTLYDFRGVSGDLSEDNPLYGLYRFKKGFGGDFTEFIGEWDLVYSKLFYWLWTRVLPVYYTTIRKLIAIKKRLED
ncbi:MAG: lipid II:glycine glycyltransferase FemX [Acidobacteriota bacterium]